MKVKVFIEETVGQEFEVEVTSIETAQEEIEDMYKRAELVVTSTDVTSKQMEITYPDNTTTEWLEF